MKHPTWWMEVGPHIDLPFSDDDVRRPVRRGRPGEPRRLMGLVDPLVGER